MDNSDRLIYHVHLFCMCKKEKEKKTLWEYISYGGINTSECDFIFPTWRLQEVDYTFHSCPGAPHLHVAFN